MSLGLGALVSTWMERETSGDIISYRSRHIITRVARTYARGMERYVARIATGLFMRIAGVASPRPRVQVVEHGKRVNPAQCEAEADRSYTYNQFE